MPNLTIDDKKILVTGAAGFIASTLCRHLLEKYPSIKIIGIDNMNDYYDISLKEERLQMLSAFKSRFVFIKCDIADAEMLKKIFECERPSIVLNLAAQAGVRYSITNPDAYIQSNIIGFYNILESCRHNAIEHLVFASSSSVYGTNKKVPYSTDDKVDTPVSLYAATKKSNELFAHVSIFWANLPANSKH